MPQFPLDNSLAMLSGEHIEDWYLGYTDTSMLHGKILWNFPLAIPRAGFIMTLWKQPGFQHIPVASIERSWPAVTNSTAVLLFWCPIQIHSSHLGEKLWFSLRIYSMKADVLLKVHRTDNKNIPMMFRVES